MTFMLRTTIKLAILLLIAVNTGLMVLRSDIVGEYWITFVSTRTGLDQVYVMRGDGAKVKQLTNLGGPSGDDRWFYYPEWNEQDKCIGSGLGGVEEFCVSLTGEYTPIQRNNTLSQNVLNQFGVAWSQYIRRDDGDWHIVSAQNKGLFRMRADGTELVKLSSREASGRIFYFRQADLVSFLDPKQGWFLVSFDGTGETYMDANGNRSFGVTLSPDKRWLTYGINGNEIFPKGNRAVYKIIDRQTLDTYQITLYDIFSLIWSPDSKYLLYDGIDGVHSIKFPQVHDNLIFEIDEHIRDHGDYSGLYRFRQRGWAPDDERVLVQFYNNIFLLRPDGAQIFNLTGQLTVKEASERLNSQPVVYSNASWSPDGRWIVFQAEAQYMTSEIFRVRPDGSDIQNLTNEPNWDVMPGWIPFVEKSWHPELSLVGGLIGLVGLVLSKRLRRKKAA